MMEIVKRTAFFITCAILVFSVLFVANSCAGRNTKEERAMQSKTRDSLIVSMAGTNPQRAFDFVDSLSAAQAESQERLAYHRALIYNEMGKKKEVAEWCEKAIQGDALLEECPEVFYDVCDLLSTTMTYQGDNEKALSVALRGYEAAKQDMTASGRHWMAVLLHDVGYCKMLDGLVDEAEQCFSLSYIALTQIVMTDDRFFNRHSRARVTFNILDAYTSTGQYDKAKTWLGQAEEAIDMLVSSSECSEKQKNDYRGGLAIQKAIVLLETGDRRGADASYAEAQTMDYRNSGLGILESASYLERAERWDDLAKMMPRIDSLSKEWGNPASLARWKKYQVNDTIGNESLQAESM